MPEMEPTTRTKRKRGWLWIAIFAAAVLAALLLLVKFGASLWLNSQRGELEQVLARATGFTVRIKGPVTATLFPTPGLALGNIEVTRDGRSVLTAREFQSSFEVLPLLAGKYIPHGISIHGLNLRLQADAQGVPLVPAVEAETAASTGGTKARPVRYELPDRIDLHDSNVLVVSPDGKELYAVKRLNLVARPLRNKAALLQGKEGDWLLALNVKFEQTRIGELTIGPSQLTVQYGPKKLDANIDKAEVFNGSASGTVSWSDTGPAHNVSTKLTIRDFDASQLLVSFGQDSFIKGRLNLEANLFSTAERLDQLPRHARGTVKLAGEDLDLVTVNLDDLVTRIIKSQQYNLVDAAAYFFLGPLGPQVTKGLDIADVFKEMGKSGTTPNRIVRLSSSWNLAKGIATARDVALETARYRLALKGSVNLLKTEFQNVRIAVVDGRGCAIATQRLDGPIASPRIEKMNILLTLTQPMLDALSKSAKTLVTGNCDPFYTGDLLPKPVAAPAPAERAGSDKAPEEKPQSAQPKTGNAHPD